MKTVSESLLQAAVTRLVKEFRPEAIYLFGSHAWGAPDEGRDLDLLIVIPESTERPIQRMRRGHRCLRGLGLAKDVLVKTRAEFDRLRAVPSALDWLIFHRGKKLYG